MIDEAKLKDLIKAAVREVLDEMHLAVETDELNKDQVAKMLGVCTRSITTWMKRESFPYETRGGRPVFKRNSALAWWRERGRPAPQLKAV